MGTHISEGQADTGESNGEALNKPKRPLFHGKGDEEKPDNIDMAMKLVERISRDMGLLRADMMGMDGKITAMQDQLDEIKYGKYEERTLEEDLHDEVERYDLCTGYTTPTGEGEAWWPAEAGTLSHSGYNETMRGGMELEEALVKEQRGKARP